MRMIRRAALIKYLRKVFYYGIGTSLKYFRGQSYTVSTSVGDYVLFAGSSDYISNIDVYKTDLSHTSVNLTISRADLAAASTKSYALFAGGRIKTERFQTIDAFDKNLTRTSTARLRASTYDAGGATMDKTAVFAGGNVLTGVNTAAVDTYNDDLTRIPALTNLPEQPTYLPPAMGATEKITLIATGTRLTGYNRSLGRTVMTPTTEFRSNCLTARAGNYILFFDGQKIIPFRDNMTQYATITFDFPQGGYTTTTLGEYALLSGGYYNYEIISDSNAKWQLSQKTFSFDESLTKNENIANLRIARAGMAGGSVGKYAFFVGGSTATQTELTDTAGRVRDVEIYQLK